MKLSILIPHFGPIDLLMECLASLNLGMGTVFQYEILVCDQSDPEVYQKNKSLVEARFPSMPISFYHRSDKHVLRARHDLIQKATGDYVSYVDSDDLVTKGYFSLIEQAIITEHFPDIYIGGFTLCNSLGKPQKTKPFLPGDVKDHILDYFLFTYLLNSVVIKVFRRALYDVRDYSDFETINGDDWVFSYPLILKAKTIAFYPQNNGYYYRQHASSTTHRFSLEVGIRSLHFSDSAIRARMPLNPYQNALLTLGRVSQFLSVSAGMLLNAGFSFGDFFKLCEHFRETVFIPFGLSETFKLDLKKKICFYLIKYRRFKFLWLILKARLGRRRHE